MRATRSSSRRTSSLYRDFKRSTVPGSGWGVATRATISLLPRFDPAAALTIMERDDGSVILVVPNLRVVARWFNNDELVGLWDAMEETFNEIIEEATL